MRKIERIILHCSATSNPNITISHIKRWHTDPKPRGEGWPTVGYHLFIRTNGKIQKGLPIEKAGIHCSGYNRTSIGICLNGLKLSDFKEMQFISLERVLEKLKPKFPLATIHGHRDFNILKECPVYSIARFQRLWLSLPIPPSVCTN